jgi:5'-deoxynucleotidase YfbR-like HD superfamily hydrolase
MMQELKDWTDVIAAASEDVRRLSHVVRFSSIPVAVSENVAEHSYWVALYGALIHKHMRPGDYETTGAVVLGAVLHDLAECVTGDVVRTFKYSSTKLKAAIDEAEHLIVKQLPAPILQVYDLQDHLRFKDRPYVEAVVKAADFLSLVQYMVREARRGNREIIHPYYLRMEEDLRSMQTRYEGDESFHNLYRDMGNFAREVRLGG